MYTWLPLISKHFSSVNPFTVYDLTLDWWRIYVAQAKAIQKAFEDAKNHKK